MKIPGRLMEGEKSHCSREENNIGSIGIFNEYTIHSQLKSEYAGKNDKTEQKLEGYLIDIVKKRPGLLRYRQRIF